MLKFSLTLPIIISLYTSFSQAQYDLPSCAVSCAQAAAYQAGCNPNDPACVCANDAFIGAAYSCLLQSCSSSDAQTALNYWYTACGGYGPSSGTGSTPTVTPSSYGPPSSSPGSKSRTSSAGYGYPTVTSSQPTTSTSITSSNPYSYGGSSSSTSSPVSSSNPYPYGGSSSTTNSHVSSSNPNPYGGSSASGSASGYSSRPSSSTSSNLAATMPTHAAALIAGGIGAMVAVFV